MSVPMGERTQETREPSLAVVWIAEWLTPKALLALGGTSRRLRAQCGPFPHVRQNGLLGNPLRMYQIRWVSDRKNVLKTILSIYPLRTYKYSNEV